MNEIEKSFKELIKSIENNSVYKEFLEVQELLLKNNEINALIKEIKDKQKEIVKKQALKENVKDLEKQLDALLKKINNYPLYERYLYLQKELNTMFQIVKNTIEKCLNDITN